MDDLQQGKSEGFESCDRPIVRKRPIWVKIGDVLYRVTLEFDRWPWKTIGHLSFAVSSFVQHFIAIGKFKLELQSGNTQFESNSMIFKSRVTLKFDVWPWKTQGKSEGFESCDRPIVRKRPIWVKIGDILYRVTLKFDGWPWKTIGYISFAFSSFVQHFIAIGEFKLELQSGNAQFGSKSTSFFSRATLQFDVWPWKTIGHLFYATSSFVHHFVDIGDFKLELQSGNAQFGSNSTIFRAVWPCNLTYDLEKKIGHLYYATTSSMHHFVAIGEFKLELQSGNAQFGSKSTIFFSRVTLQFDVWPWKTIGHLFHSTSSFVHHFVAIG